MDEHHHQHLGLFGNVGFISSFRPRKGYSPSAEGSFPVQSVPHSSLFECHGKGTKRKWDDSPCAAASQHLSLKLGLGLSPSSSETSKVSSACTVFSAKDVDEESSMELNLNFELCLGNEKTHCQKRSHVIDKVLSATPKLDLQLSLFTGAAATESVITDRVAAPSRSQIGGEQEFGRSDRPFASHSIASASLSSASDTTSAFRLMKFSAEDGAEVRNFTPDHSPTIFCESKSPVACTSGVTNHQRRNTITRICQVQGCQKGARGASGRCIAHGGGRRCKKPGCPRGAEGRTAFCKAHGGGKRCEFFGCTKSAEGRTEYCISHGGGRRCSSDGCTKAARGKSGLCIKHGGGKRCKRENCTRSAEGFSGLCISHGGGRRCQFKDCPKGAQGSTRYCKAHGGGKRCTHEGCNKGAEGSTLFCKAHGGGKRCAYQGGGVCPKSVHGGTQFCVAHGGGKRCVVSGCSKSARGRTNFCVRHGGGKRCSHVGCGKSAQGSTDFCKAHGGGKRCVWGHPGEACGVGQPPCDKFARSKTGLCLSHSALVQDHCIHGGGTLGSASHQDLRIHSSGALGTLALRQDLTVHNGGAIQPGLQAYAAEPERMKQSEVQKGANVSLRCPESSLLCWSAFGAMSAGYPPVPEGRVHGGKFMALLSRSVGGQVRD